MFYLATNTKSYTTYHYHKKLPKRSVSGRVEVDSDLRGSGVGDRGQGAGLTCDDVFSGLSSVVK